MVLLSQVGWAGLDLNLSPTLTKQSGSVKFVFFYTEHLAPREPGLGGVLHFVEQREEKSNLLVGSVDDSEAFMYLAFQPLKRVLLKNIANY